MAKSSILLDLNDARSEKIAEVLGNKTAKRILGALAEGEKCGSDLSGELRIPLNTVSYNIKKLVDAGLIEKSKKFFWSMKGRKMDYYRVVNKRIVIMPKQMIKGILPAVVVSGLAAVGIKMWTDMRIMSGTLVDSVARESADSFVEADKTLAVAGEAAGSAVPQAMQNAADGSVGLCSNVGILSIAQNAWMWFFVGALMALFVYLLWNLWRRK